jgi:type III secretory pathway component EscU
MVEQIISLAGAGMILAAYGAQQLQKLDSNSLLYIVLNLIGSLILAVIAYHIWQTGMILVEGSLGR